MRSTATPPRLLLIAALAAGPAAGCAKHYAPSTVEPIRTERSAVDDIREPALEARYDADRAVVDVRALTRVYRIHRERVISEKRTPWDHRIAWAGSDDWSTGSILTDGLANLFVLLGAPFHGLGLVLTGNASGEDREELTADWEQVGKELTAEEPRRGVTLRIWPDPERRFDVLRVPNDPAAEPRRLRVADGEPAARALRLDETGEVRLLVVGDGSTVVTQSDGSLPPGAPALFVEHAASAEPLTQALRFELVEDGLAASVSIGLRDFTAAMDDAVDDLLLLATVEVVDDATRFPVSGARVQLFAREIYTQSVAHALGVASPELAEAAHAHLTERLGDRPPAVTAPDGRASVPVFVPGGYEIFVRAPGYRAQRIEREWLTSRSRSVTVFLRPDAADSP